eukprot:349119_1
MVNSIRNYQYLTGLFQRLRIAFKARINWNSPEISALKQINGLATNYRNTWQTLGVHNPIKERSVADTNSIDVAIDPNLLQTLLTTPGIAQTILYNHCKLHGVESAIQLMYQCRTKYGAQPSYDTLSILIAACSVNNLIDTAEHLFVLACERSHNKSDAIPLSVFAALVMVYSNIGDYRSSIDLLQRMKTDDKWPNPNSYCLKYLTSTQKWELVSQLLDNNQINIDEVRNTIDFIQKEETKPNYNPQRNDEENQSKSEFSSQAPLSEWFEKNIHPSRNHRKQSKTECNSQAISATSTDEDKIINDHPEPNHDETSCKKEGKEEQDMTLTWQQMDMNGVVYHNDRELSHQPPMVGHKTEPATGSKVNIHPSENITNETEYNPQKMPAAPDDKPTHIVLTVQQMDTDIANIQKLHLPIRMNSIGCLRKSIRDKNQTLSQEKRDFILYYLGKELTPNKCFRNYNIVDGATIQWKLKDTKHVTPTPKNKKKKRKINKSN